MSDNLPKNKEEFLKIQHVTVANYNKFGEYFLKISQVYRSKVETLEAKMRAASITTLPSAENYEDSEDWVIPSSQTKGVKRKSTGLYKKGAAKRYKGNFKKRKWKSPSKKKKSPAKKTFSPKKSGGGKKGGGGGGSSLGLMPVLQIK